MGINNEESTDLWESRSLSKAFEQLIHDLENEPNLILEGENQSIDGEYTLKEISSWLFDRRSSDDCTNNSL